MKKIILIIAGALLATAVLFIVVLTPSAQSCYEKGRHALLTGKYEEARKFLNKTIDKSKDVSLTADVLMSLAECSNQQGDSIQALDYIRQAALMFNRYAQAVYGEYLNRHKDQKDEFISYYTYLNEHSPQDSKYAGKLARIYLFDSSYRDIDKAGQLLQPFVSRSGSGDGDPNTLAYAAYLLANGAGGYAESPESAVMLSSKCSKHVNSVIEDAAIDPEALFILGDMALAESAYDANSSMYGNVRKAQKLYEAAVEKVDGEMRDMCLDRISWIEKFCNESDNVSLDPHWWDKKPNDWTQFFNHESGFRYLGHTNESGHQGAHGGNEYPTGWGIGAWTKDGTVFLGKWKAGRADEGIYVWSNCSSSLCQ